LQIQEAYVWQLVATLPKRTSNSRTTAAMTVLGNLPKDPAQVVSVLSQIREILLQEFDNLHPYDQEYLLTQYWEQVRDPSLQPAIERMLTKGSQPQKFANHGPALKRLIELDPERARAFVIAELRDPASLVDLDILRSLKDETLPEADASLLEQIRRLAPLSQRSDFVFLGHKALLAARYASPAIYGALQETYQTFGSKWQPDARAGLLGYLARYKEEDAIPMIEQALAELGRGQDSTFLLHLTYWHYSEAIDNLLAKRLESDEPDAVGGAAYVMSRRGPATDRPLIEARLARWVKEWSGRGVDMNDASDSQALIEGGMQVNLVDALLHANAWKLSDESMKQLKQSCLSQRCLQYFPKQ
jgi:hypothetical protein